MDFQQIRKYVKGVLTNSFLNKTTLDKLSTSDAGNLLFDGKEISGSGGSETSNYFYLIDYNSMESVNSRDFIAEKDCYIEVETYANDNKEEHYYINNIFVGRESINGEVIYLKSFFLNKGDNIKLRDGVSHSTTIRIFDLLNNKYNYSTEEQIVGTWVNGKPLYEKTFKTTVNVTGSTEYFSNVIVEDAEEYFIENAFCTENENGTGAIQMIGSVNFNGNYDYNITSFNLNTGRWWIIRGGGTSPYTTIIVRYTKTTD